MSDFLDYEGLKFSHESKDNVNDGLAVEAPLEISINNTPFTVVMQTPGQELELAVGLLYAEDVINQGTAYTFDIEDQKINFIIDPQLIRDGILSSRSLLSVSSCGICGKKDLDAIEINGEELSDTYTIKPALIESMFEKMKAGQKLFDSTGGTHAIAAFNLDGELLSLKEDVGRHNALDKVVGDLILKKKLNTAKIITCSGRLSYEIVSKAFRAKISILSAVSAPTTLAVDFAKEYGITLLGFSRGNKFTCYANPYRISQ